MSLNSKSLVLNFQRKLWRNQGMKVGSLEEWKEVGGLERELEGNPVLGSMLVLCPPPSTPGRGWETVGKCESRRVERSSALLSAFNSRKAARAQRVSEWVRRLVGLQTAFTRHGWYNHVGQEPEITVVPWPAYWVSTEVWMANHQEAPRRTEVSHR